MTDNVNHPSHYKIGGLEVIDILKAKMSRERFLGFLQGNILKYHLRAEYKNGVEDIEKAEWYTRKLIEEEKSPPSHGAYRREISREELMETYPSDVTLAPELADLEKSDELLPGPEMD